MNTVQTATAKSREVNKKSFLAIEGAKIKGGYLYLHLYQLKRSGMEYVGMARYQPQSTRGAESEIMEALANAGKIPKKYADSGLYYSNEGRPFNVNIIDSVYLDKCIDARKSEYLFN